MFSRQLFILTFFCFTLMCSAHTFAQEDWLLERGWSYLHKAAYEGKIDDVRFLISEGANINAKSKDNDTPLHVALMNEEEDIASVLILEGADVNAKGYEDDTPLHIAAGLGLLRIVNLLIENGAAIEAKNTDSWTPLYMAVIQEQKNSVSTLISKGADVNVELDDEYIWKTYPLHEAILNGLVDIAHLLVLNGANINTFGSSKFKTPLALAIIKNQNNLTHLLLSKGASINDQDKRTGMTSLHINDDKNEVRKLIKRGAKVNVPDHFGITPLHHQAKTKGADIASVLIFEGANINAKDYVGNTPLHIATNLGDTQMTSFLIEKGADANVVNIEGKTPLHTLADGRSRVLGPELTSTIIDILIYEGLADINAQDTWGHTPLHIALRYGDTKLATTLIARGADKYIRDNYDHIPDDYLTRLRVIDLLETNKK